MQGITYIVRQDLLLIEATKQEFGYNPLILSYGSSRKILHKCDVCGKIKKNAFHYFVKGKALSHQKCKTTKARQTCSERYGVNNPSKSQKIKEKKRQIYLKRYRVDNPQKCKEIREKTKQTWLNKYGADNPSKSEKIKKRKRQTSLKNYGVEHPWQSIEIKQRREKACLKKYGVNNPSKSQKIKEKKRQTRLNNGYDWTERRARDFVEMEAPGYSLLKWGGDAHKKSMYECSRGDVYTAKMNDFQQGYRCPICNESKGERETSQVLTKLGLSFKRQYKLGKGRSTLKLDFYVPSPLNLGVEFDGPQHFEPQIGWYRMSQERAEKAFKKQQERDQRKNKLCEQLGITLYRISYTDNVEQKLKEILSKYFIPKLNV